MNRSKLMQKIEELSMNALPAMQTQIYDGWVIRFADGYTKRANSINPIAGAGMTTEKAAAVLVIGSLIALIAIRRGFRGVSVSGMSGGLVRG